VENPVETPVEKPGIQPLPDGPLAFEAFQPGQTWRSSTVLLRPEMIRRFAALTGDHNPIHLDPDFAARTLHRGVIAHGLLISSLAAGMAYDIGLLGPNILALERSESVYRRAARPGDRLYGTVEILSTDPRAGRRVGRVTWDTRVLQEREAGDREVCRVVWTTLVFKEAFLPRPAAAE